MHLGAPPLLRAIADAARPYVETFPVLETLSTNGRPILLASVTKDTYCLRTLGLCFAGRAEMSIITPVRFASFANAIVKDKIDATLSGRLQEVEVGYRVWLRDIGLVYTVVDDSDCDGWPLVWKSFARVYGEFPAVFFEVRTTPRTGVLTLADRAEKRPRGVVELLQGAVVPHKVIEA